MSAILTGKPKALCDTIKYASQGYLDFNFLVRTTNINTLLHSNNYSFHTSNAVLQQQLQRFSVHIVNEISIDH